MKLFGIGAQRTGTTSLHCLLGNMGYTSVHWPTTFEDIKGATCSIDGLVIPLWEQLDKYYEYKPMFIQTVRDEDSWLFSIRQWFEQSAVMNLEKAMIRHMIYGGWDFDEDTYIGAYRRYNARIAEYFSGCRDRILVLDIVGGTGTSDHVSNFLGISRPPMPMPKENMRSDKYASL